VSTYNLRPCPVFSGGWQREFDNHIDDYKAWVKEATAADPQLAHLVAAASAATKAVEARLVELKMASRGDDS